jgi:hypothetical protein
MNSTHQCECEEGYDGDACEEAKSLSAKTMEISRSFFRAIGLSEHVITKENIDIFVLYAEEVTNLHSSKIPLHSVLKDQPSNQSADELVIQIQENGIELNEAETEIIEITKLCATSEQDEVVLKQPSGNFETSSENGGYEGIEIILEQFNNSANETTIDPGSTLPCPYVSRAGILVLLAGMIFIMLSRTHVLVVLLVSHSNEGNLEFQEALFRELKKKRMLMFVRKYNAFEDACFVYQWLKYFCSAVRIICCHETSSNRLMTPCVGPVAPNNDSSYRRGWKRLRDRMSAKVMFVLGPELHNSHTLDQQFEGSASRFIQVKDDDESISEMLMACLQFVG